MRPDLQDDEAKANERLAQLTGICPKCGDEGWWIDDRARESWFHYCTCPAGIKAQEEDEGGD
jgi:hypothetical protein